MPKNGTDLSARGEVERIIDSPANPPTNYPAIGLFLLRKRAISRDKSAILSGKSATS